MQDTLSQHNLINTENIVMLPTGDQCNDEQNDGGRVPNLRRRLQMEKAAAHQAEALTKKTTAAAKKPTKATGHKQGTKKGPAINMGRVGTAPKFKGLEQQRTGM
jgi:hypothetical protein